MNRVSFAATPILAISFTLMWSLGQLSAAGSADQGFERVLARSNNVAPPPYKAFRRLEGGVKDSDKHGWLEAWTEYQPGRGLSFEVVREGGSEYVRNKVLRGMLSSEQELIAQGKRVRTSLDSKNYLFEEGGMTDAGLHRILMVPIKKSDGLVDGSVFVEPETGLIARLQGRLVKSPSFWVRDVDVTWKFTRMGNAIVPTELSSSARVMFYGRQPFKMTYQYETVDGRSVAAATRASLQDQR